MYCTERLGTRLGTQNVPDVCAARVRAVQNVPDLFFMGIKRVGI